MSSESRDPGQQTSSAAQQLRRFVWPLGISRLPDEMNTSFGPRIDADRWDFHDGIDLPAPVGTPVHAVTDGVVHRAGPADKVGNSGFGSTHILLKARDPTDGKNDLFLVYLHLDSIAPGVVVGALVHQGEVIGAVGQEDATYPHLHFEVRKGDARQVSSVHPLRYLGYRNSANFTQLRLDRCNFSRAGDDSRAVRVCFEAVDRREGDVQGVNVELISDDNTVETLKRRVDFDDRATIKSEKGDEHAFTNGIAVEGYQKSNLKGEGLEDLHYGVIVKDIVPRYKFLKLEVMGVRKSGAAIAKFPLPELEAQAEPVNSRVGFDNPPFPPQGWGLDLLAGNTCRPDVAAAIAGSKGLLCEDMQSQAPALVRAGLRFALPVNRLPVRPMSWRLRADIRPAELQLSQSIVIYPLAFLSGGELVAAASIRKISDSKLVAGVVIRNNDGLFGEKIDVDGGDIHTDGRHIRWELELLRIGTRQTTAVLRFTEPVKPPGSGDTTRIVARINGDTTNVEPDAACVGILHRHVGLRTVLHLDQLRLTEALRS